MRFLLFILLLPVLLPAQAVPPPPPPASPLSIVILANAAVPESLELARYYAAKRGIPEANIVALPMPKDETIDWPAYVRQVQNPLRRWLHDNAWLKDEAIDRVDAFGRIGGNSSGASRIAFLVLCKGVPLRISEDPQHLSPEAQEAFVHALGPQGEALRTQTTFGEHLARSRAAVDSELAGMLLPGNLLLGALPNPLFRNILPDTGARDRVIKVARLDGPSFRDARALVDGALTAEALGLRGRVYIDRGGPYPLGNQWLEQLERAFRDTGWDVSVDTARTRFAAGARFDSPAVYFGWHANHIEGPFLEPDFRFPPGAVAVHLHSFSAATLRDPAKGWSGPLVGRGAAATIGNVYEPTLGMTHNLDVLGLCLLTGWSWGDAAWCAMPVLSWHGIVLGDPLYVPMKVNLDEQLRLLGELENLYLGQYPVIRAMRLLQKRGDADGALALGKRAFASQPGLVLAVELARMEKEAGRGAEAASQIAFLSTMRQFSNDDRGIALDAANLLAELGKQREALALLATLRTQPKMSDGLRGAILAAGLKLATQLGDLQEISRWQPAAPRK